MFVNISSRIRWDKGQTVTIYIPIKASRIIGNKVRVLHGKANRATTITKKYREKRIVSMFRRWRCEFAAAMETLTNETPSGYRLKKKRDNNGNKLGSDCCS